MENALLQVWHGHLLEAAGMLSKEKNKKQKHHTHIYICHVIWLFLRDVTGSLGELSHCDLRLNASLCISLVIHL